jgi:hypothetical protein
MSDCIIISAGATNSEYTSRIQRNLGPYRIASALEKEGYQSSVIDFTQYFTIQELIKSVSKVLTKNTLWVGFSSTFFWGGQNNKSLFPHITFDDLDILLNYIRTNSNAKIVYGGVRSFWASDNRIDNYILGYADNAVIDYTNKIRKNILVPKEINSKDYPEPSMNNIKTHWWRKDFNILPGEALPLEMARGCIFKCKFCGYSLIGKKKGTYIRDIEEVREDLIRTWEATGCTNYYITDDTFNDDDDKIKMIHKLFTSLPFKIKFSCYLRLDLINRFPHQADLLLEAGLVGNFFGIESLQPKSGKIVGKGLEPNKVKETLNWLRNKWGNKVNMGAGIIFGLPYDTVNYFKEIKKWIVSKDNPLTSIEVYPLILFKSKKNNMPKNTGSEFSKNPEIYGYDVADDNTWKLERQKLNFNMVQEYANEIMSERYPINKVSEFQIMTQQNVGIPMKDLMDTYYIDLQDKFDMKTKNNNKLNEYKKMIGII